MTWDERTESSEVFHDGRPLPHGPWTSEPNKVSWIDADTDLDCLIVRGPMGALCGYVGVQPGHPWHGQDRSDIDHGVDVHGERLATQVLAVAS